MLARHAGQACVHACEACRARLCECMRGMQGKPVCLHARQWQVNVWHAHTSVLSYRNTLCPSSANSAPMRIPIIPPPPITATSSETSSPCCMPAVTQCMVWIGTSSCMVRVSERVSVGAAACACSVANVVDGVATLRLRVGGVLMLQRVLLLRTYAFSARRSARVCLGRVGAVACVRACVRACVCVCVVIPRLCAPFPRCCSSL
jgi:hypothetical protein